MAGRGGFLANFLSGLAGGYFGSRDRNDERKRQAAQQRMEQQRIDQSQQQYAQDRADRERSRVAALQMAYGGNSPESIQRAAATYTAPIPFTGGAGPIQNSPAITDPFSGLKPGPTPEQELLGRGTMGAAHLYQNPQAMLQLGAAQMAGPVPQQGNPAFKLPPFGINPLATPIPAQRGVSDYVREAGPLVETMREQNQQAIADKRAAGQLAIQQWKAMAPSFKDRSTAETNLFKAFQSAGGGMEYWPQFRDAMMQGVQPAAATAPSPAGPGPGGDLTKQYAAQLAKPQPAPGGPISSRLAPGLNAPVTPAEGPTPTGGPASPDFAAMFPHGTTAQATIGQRNASAAASTAHAGLYEQLAELAPEKQAGYLANLKARGLHWSRMDDIALKRVNNERAYQQGRLQLGQGQLDLGKRRADIAQYNAEIGAEVRQARIQLDAAGLNKGVNQARIQGYNQQINQMGSQVNTLNKKAIDAYAAGDPKAGDTYAGQAKTFTEQYLAPLINERQKYYGTPPIAPVPQIGVGRRGGVPLLPPAGASMGSASKPPPSREAAEAMLRAKKARPEEIDAILKQTYGR